MSDQDEFNFSGNGGGKRTRKRAAPRPAAEAETAPAPEPEPETVPGEDSPPAGSGNNKALPHAEGPLQRLIDDNFLQYASYVIRDRAIPELEDGLKPVQRRILYSLKENDDGKFIKVANIAGYCMQYHPHGNVSIEDALVTLVNRGNLIEGQGNFGNLLTGDPAAASRYIECRLTDLARNQLFNDQLTRFIPSYDGRRKEPVALPAKLPLLLMLGAEGIAVGLSTRIFPHNLQELLQAQVAILQKKRFEVYPDFHQGGLMDASEYDRGNGRIRLRAVIEQDGDRRLVVRQIPYSTTTDGLIASIEDAVRKKKIKIRSISDFTAEQVEIEILLSPGEDPERVTQGLYAFTQCEVTLSGRTVVIRERRPVEMNVEEILRHNTKRLVQILEKELKLERQRLLDELHFKTLIQLFVEHRIYKRIEECTTYPDVQQAVLDGMNAFREQLRRDVTRKDVETLLGIPIKRISRFDINRNRKEIGEILAGLDEVERNLERLVPYAIDYLKALLKPFGRKPTRKTQITSFEQVARRELTANELTIRYDKEKGYLGYDVEGDPLFDCSSLDKIVLAWGDGRYKMMPPPEKLFVDKNVVYCSLFERDQEFTIVYTLEGATSLKRFTFGGAIMNREYLCTPKPGKVHLFMEGCPKEIFVKYRPAKNQRIHQQVFRGKDAQVKGVKARGIQMTVKKISSISVTKPRRWDAKGGTPRGVTLDLGNGG